MLLVRKSPITINQARDSRRELEHLYARRSAIDTLIESLEEYDRIRAKREVGLTKLKTA